MSTKAAWRVENAVHLTQLLAPRRPEVAEPPAALVERLQKLARRAHRNAERMCNGELLECSACRGDGYGCAKCGGTGYPALASEKRAVERLREDLKPYRLRVYEQGDPRGWPLYLIPEESGPASEDQSWYNSRGTAVCPH